MRPSGASTSRAPNRRGFASSRPPSASRDAYSAAHALCLAALRHHGFRPSKRYIVFQVLPDTLGLGPEVWRILSKCHDMRNRTECEGALDVDDRLVSDLIGACRKVAEKVRSLA